MPEAIPEAQRAAAGPGPRTPRASSRSEVASFIVMDVMREAAVLEAQGRGIVHMEVGQPATPAPRAAREAVRRALETDTLGYSLALGHPALRARISRLYRDWYGLDVAAERIIVTTGSSAGFILAFLALFDAGDKVVLPSPGYPCYRHIMSALGIGTRLIETGEEGRWMPLGEQLAPLAGEQGVRGLLIASPANPTGTMIGPERHRELAEVCRRRGLWLISDEIYHGLTYHGPAVTALAVSEDAVVINSFSKYFSMTGWRVGWMVVPDALVRTFERLAQNLFISPPAVSQVAALGAFEGLDELEANRRVYAQNRTVLVDGLAAMGLTRLAPADGAFYVYADAGHVTGDSRAFASRLLREAGVAATPGLDFDEERGHRFLRFSYAGTTADMREAVRRMGDWGGFSSRV